MPANPMVQFTQFSDPVLRGSVYGTFREWNESQTEIYKQVFQEIETQKPFEEFAEFATLGLAPRQNEGSLAAGDVVKEGYTYRLNVFLYGLNMNVGQIALKTKQLREAINGTKAVAEALYNTREIIHADMFGNAFSTTVGLLPDSLPMCSAVGKLPRGGTMSNTLGAASLSEATVEAAYILADKMPGGHGIPVGKEITGLLIPPDYRFDVIRIFQSTLQNWTANNAINALKQDGAVPKIIKNRFLPSSSNFFFLTNAEMGLITLWLQKPEVEEVGQSLTKSTVFYGSQIFGLGCVNRRKVIGSSI